MTVKEYDIDYMDILSSIEGEYLSKNQINKKISKMWNVEYSFIKELSKQSDEIYKSIKTDK